MGLWMEGGDIALELMGKIIDEVQDKTMNRGISACARRLPPNQSPRFAVYARAAAANGSRIDCEALRARSVHLGVEEGERN